MARMVRDVMTPDPKAVESTVPVVQAARRMRDDDVGAIIVMKDGGIFGIIIDRDIAIRGVAEHRDLATTTVGEICSPHLVGLEPSAGVADAVQLMRDNAVRRLPVVAGDRPIGIVSLGDLVTEKERDGGKVLAGVSSAPPNR